MFGKDFLTLSKPREIKTVAKSFSETMKKVPTAAAKPITQSNRDTAPLPPVRAQLAKPSLPPVGAKQELNNSNLNDIQITMRKGYLKLEMVKPVARNFLNQVHKLEDISDNGEGETDGKIIFSYSDGKGRWGKLENAGEKIKVRCKKQQQNGFDHEQIDIYSLNGYNIQSNGLFIQVKGWGNLKELSLVNALKNSLKKLPGNNSLTDNEKIIHSYSLSSISQIPDGGWECKVKVTPGRVK